MGVYRIITVCVLILAVACGNSRSLSDGVAALDHRIFVSSASFSAPTDASCQTLATNAGLERTYKAVFSTSTSNAITALTITGAVYNFSAADTGVLIANDEAHLFDAGTTNLLNEIEYTESYVQVAGGTAVWTGTKEDGTVTANHCVDWTSTAGGNSGNYGVIGGLNGTWTESANGACNVPRRIYCISQ